MNQVQNKTQNNQPQWEQEFEDFGNEAANRVKELVEEGKVRRLVIRKASQDVLLDVPLLPALVAGGVMTLWMPYLTILSVLVAFAAKLKLEIVNTDTVSDNTDSVEITS